MKLSFERGDTGGKDADMKDLKGARRKRTRLPYSASKYLGVVIKLDVANYGLYLEQRIPSNEYVAWYLGAWLRT